jgi:hypothetical protein
VGQDGADLIMVGFETDIMSLQLIIELTEKNRLPMIYPRGSERQCPTSPIKRNTAMALPVYPIIS